MKRIDLLAAAKWDDLELLRAEAGEAFSEASDENWAKYRRLNDRVPKVQAVRVVAASDCFSVAPSPEQAHNQLACGTLYRIARDLGWRVSNLVERFDPMLALQLARRYGPARLRYRSSWWKVSIPPALEIKGALQEHPESVSYMIEALEGQEQQMSVGEFFSLSARSIARTLPPGEASQYLEAMGVR